MQAVDELNKVLAAFIALQRSVQRSSFEAVRLPPALSCQGSRTPSVMHVLCIII